LLERLAREHGKPADEPALDRERISREGNYALTPRPLFISSRSSFAEGMLGLSAFRGAVSRWRAIMIA
jgi:hypothetical protein